MYLICLPKTTSYEGAGTTSLALEMQQNTLEMQQNTQELIIRMVSDAIMSLIPAIESYASEGVFSSLGFSGLGAWSPSCALTKIDGL